MNMIDLWRALAVLLCLLAAPAGNAATIQFAGADITVAGCTRSGTTYNCSVNPFANDAAVVIASGYTVAIATAPSIAWASSLTMSGTAALAVVSGNLNLSNMDPTHLHVTGGTLSTPAQFELGYSMAITAGVSAATVKTNASGTITGDVHATGDVTLASGAVITGNLWCNDLNTNSPATITGNITATGYVKLGSGATVTGNITGTSLTTNSPATITGNIAVSGLVDLGSGATVTGNIAGSGLTTNSPATVTGNITVSGTIDLGSGFTITGDLSADIIKSGNPGTITGDINATTSIKIGYGDTVTGDLSAPLVTLGGAVTINGNVTATALEQGYGSIVTGTKTCTTFSGSGTPCTPPASGPNHYQLSMPSAGINCLPNTVTVTACANTSSPCTSKAANMSGKQATLSVSSGGVLGGATLTFDATGVASTTLSYPTANNSNATVTLSGEQSVASAARTCCLDGVACSISNSCAATFGTSGFIFSSVAGATGNLANQVAGTASGSQYLRAVKGDGSTMACTAALAGTQTVGLAYECQNPTTCSGSNLMLVNATTIAHNDFAASTTYQPVSLTFDANGSAPFTFRFDDVGKVKLRAKKTTANSAVLSGVSNDVVVKPAGFSLSLSAPALPSPVAGTEAGAVYVRAGAPFTATVTALTSQFTSGGVQVPALNYGKENPAEGVKLAVSAAVDPATGAAFADMTNLPLLNGTFGAFSAGVASGSAFSWDEAGIIMLTPGVADGDYLGSGAATGAAVKVGRFTPSYLAVTPGGVTNRSATGCASSSNFTYMGEAMAASFTLTAKAAGGAVTQNYRGKFAKFNPAAAAGAADWGQLALAAVDSDATRKAFPACTAPAAHACITPGAATVVATPATPWMVTVNAQATVFRGALAVGPFDSFELGIAPVDGDGVTARPADFDLDTNVTAAAANRAKIGVTKVRYGRLRIDNAYGSELLRLPVGLAAQYWNSNDARYVTNSDDSCTPLDAANFTVAAGNGAAIATGIEAGATMRNGVSSSFRLRKPSPTPGGKGSVVLRTSPVAPSLAPLNSYLPGGSTVTFGVYKSGPVIFFQEMY